MPRIIDPNRAGQPESRGRYFLKRCDQILEFRRDRLWGPTCIKANRFADPHSDLPWRGNFSAGLFDLEEAVDAHRKHRHTELAREQADARAKIKQVAVSCVMAFGKTNTL